MKTWHEEQQDNKYNLLNEIMGLKTAEEHASAYKRSIMRKADSNSLDFYPRLAQLLVFRKNLQLKTIGDYTVLVSKDRDNDTYGILVKKIEVLPDEDWSTDLDDVEPFLEADAPGVYTSGIEFKEDVPNEVRTLINKLRRK
jgi:hypothetical protein